jgi:Cu(I)/Ag(I) efflux system membrane fusion protein
VALRPGTIARVTLPDTGESFKARVSDVLPEVDAASHVLTVRLEAANPGFRLRPDMFVNVELPVSHASGLSVPADAVLNSGLSKRVFVQTSEGYFEPRTVETGWSLGERVQVVRGLNAGDVVASGGTFLVDSESKMHNAAHAGSVASSNRSSAEMLHGEQQP